MSTGTFCLRTRVRVLHKGHDACWYCGSPLSLDQMTVDHFCPKSKGGRGNINNLVPACRLCNCSKGARELEEFRWTIRQKDSEWAAQGLFFSAAQRKYLESIGSYLPDPPWHRFWFEVKSYE